MAVSTVERRIMWGDLDALGIVFYPRYAEWMDGASHLFFESIGLSLDALMQQRSLGFGLAETGCRYLRPGRYHQKIRIVSRIGDLVHKTLVVHHRIEDAADGDAMVEGTETRICMDVSNPQHFRAVAIPADIAAVLARARD